MFNAACADDKKKDRVDFLNDVRDGIDKTFQPFVAVEPAYDSSNILFRVYAIVVLLLLAEQEEIYSVINNGDFIVRDVKINSEFTFDFI